MANTFIEKITLRVPVPLTYIKFYLIALKNPIYFLKRVVYKRFLLRPKIKINQETGFVKVAQSELKGLDSLLPVLYKLCQDKLSALDHNLLTRLEKAGKIKPYFINLLQRSDIDENLAIIKFALSDEMLSIVADKMGFIPNLSHIALFYSGFGKSFDPARDEPQGTQKFHIDNQDISHVKYFLYLDDVTEKDGPLTILPSKKTRWLKRITNRILSTRPFKRDSDFKKYISDSDLIPLKGTKGDSFFISTSEVYHYGSRYSQGGRRFVLVIHYVAAAEYSKGRSNDYQDLNLATSHEIRELLDLTPTQAIAYKLVKADEATENLSNY